MDEKLNKILEEIGNINNRFDNLENRFDNLENRFDNLENRFDNLENQTKENTQILKALMHSAEVNKAEHDKMMVGLARVEGDVVSIKRNVSTLEIVTANNYAELAKLKAVK